MHKPHSGMRFLVFLAAVLSSVNYPTAAAAPITCEETPITESGATVYIPGERPVALEFRLENADLFAFSLST